MAVPVMAPFEDVHHHIFDLFRPFKLGGENRDADQEQWDAARAREPARESCQDDKCKADDERNRLADEDRNSLPLILYLYLHVISIARVD